MKLDLLAGDPRFFEILKDHAAIVTQAAGAMQALLQSFDGAEAQVQRMTDLETKGHDLERAMKIALNKSFITPIDREDLNLLSHSLQGVLGYVEGTASRMLLYHIKSCPVTSRELCSVLLSSTELLSQAFQDLHRFEPSEQWTQMKELERQGDRLCAQGIAELFDNGQAVLEIIKWKEIYEDLEEAIDRCEDVFDVLETVMVKHA